MKRFALLLTLSLATHLMAAQFPQWIASITLPYLSSAGNSDFGTVDNNGTVNTFPATVVQSTLNTSFLLTHTTKQQTSHWYASYFRPTWQAAAPSNNNISYQGFHQLLTLGFQHGYSITVNNKLLLNIHAGFEYNTLHNETSLHSGADQISNNNLKLGKSSFTGMGPSVGFTLTRKMYWGFNFVNQADFVLNYGQITASTLSIGGQRQSSPSHNIVVPGMSMKIALNYAHPFKHSWLSSDAGILFKQFFNVSNTHNVNNTNNNNVAFYGPFLRVSLGF